MNAKPTYAETGKYWAEDDKVNLRKLRVTTSMKEMSEACLRGVTGNESEFSLKQMKAILHDAVNAKTKMLTKKKIITKKIRNDFSSVAESEKIHKEYLNLSNEYAKLTREYRELNDRKAEDMAAHLESQRLKHEAHLLYERDVYMSRWRELKEWLAHARSVSPTAGPLEEAIPLSHIERQIYQIEQRVGGKKYTPLSEYGIAPTRPDEKNPIDWEKRKECDKEECDKYE